MPVYDLCMKIIKRNIPIMMIYIIVFLTVSIAVTSSSTKSQKSVNEFVETKTNMAFITEEKSPLIEGLRSELGKTANFIDLPGEKEAQQDALFFREVVYILRIPEGFTQKFMEGKEVFLEKTCLPDSASAAYIDLAVEKYLNTARFYLENLDGITQETLVRYLSENFSEKTAVTMLPAPARPELSGITHSYNYMSYSLSSILILGMAAILSVLNNKDLRNRISCSPVRETAANLQILLASLTFAFAAWLTQIVFCLVFDLDNLLTINTLLFIVSSLVFTVCGTALGFLIGSVVKSNEAISAVTNVVVLGSSFISGVFVPSQFLGEMTLKVASFTPFYWFVKANNQIAQLSQFDFSHIKPVLSDIAVVLCFALAFLALSLVIRKERRYS